MKRSRLDRKAPLKGGDSHLKRTKLNPRSEKTQKRYTEERIPFVKRILEERPSCQACHLTPMGAMKQRRSVEVHEILSRGRSGGVHGEAWLDEDNVLALCWLCHRWVTDNPKEAEALGLLRKSNQ